MRWSSEKVEKEVQHRRYQPVEKASAQINEQQESKEAGSIINRENRARKKVPQHVATIQRRNWN